MKKQKFYINKPFWIFADNGTFHVDGCYVNGVLDPQNAYNLTNQVIEKSKRPLKVIY